MATADASVPPGARPPTEPDSSGLAAYRDATDNRSLTAALAGTSVAVLTFVLFFLYDRWSRGAINGVLFQATVLTIIGGLFFIALSSMNYWFVMEALRSDHPRPARYLQRAEATFAVGWVLLILEPTWILFTVQLYLAALVALAFWIVAVVMMALGWGDARRGRG